MKDDVVRCYGRLPRNCSPPSLPSFCETSAAFKTCSATATSPPRRFTTSAAALTSFLAGLLGGTVPRLFPTQAAYAQSSDEVLQQYKDIAVPVNKVLRAERIELVNNKGKALAVLEASYSQALPAGAPQLTFTACDELMRQDRKVRLSTVSFDMYIGKDDYLEMGPGADLTFHDAAGG